MKRKSDQGQASDVDFRFNYIQEKIKYRKKIQNECNRSRFIKIKKFPN